MSKFARISTVLVVLNSICWAWGPEGHQVVAIVAEEHLDETTKVMIQSLLGNNHLYSIASWADTVRNSNRETAPWHYVNIPLGSTYDATRDCTLPHSCIVRKIDEFVKVLIDKEASREDRAEALKFIVHFVGDIHQPMHAVGEAAGGNGIPVRFLGSYSCGPHRCNLHAVWDSSLILHAGLSREEYAHREEELITTEKLVPQATGTPQQWANESVRLAQAAWATEGSDLDERYYAEQIKVVDRQLALAGLRLATLLNATIGKMTPRDFASNPLPKIVDNPSFTSEYGQSSGAGTSRSDVKVWVNTKSGTYHCSDSHWYGTTKHGEFMTEHNALQEGFHPAAGRTCQPRL